MLKEALLIDARGNPIQQDHKVLSNDWDEILDWSSRVYTPYRVTPTGKVVRPNATMHSAQIGRISVTRFSYGIPVNIKDWSQDASNVSVLTTIQGNARHLIDPRRAETTAVGETFVVDCSRTDYNVDFDPDHLQLNLTIPHSVLDRVCLDWLGFVPDNALWQYKTRIGGNPSSWLTLLEYIVRCIAEAPDRLARDRVGHHLEQTICIHLLNEWANRAGLDLETPGNSIAPRSVRIAEQYMVDHVLELPPMTEVARAAGTSLRTLTNAFKKFRGYAPSAFMREQRLQGVRRDLSVADPGQTVSSVAYAWGYINLGEFARAYRTRFGELPSETLRRR